MLISNSPANTIFGKGTIIKRYQYLLVSKKILSHLKCSFRSQDIFPFLTFWTCKKRLD